MKILLKHFIRSTIYWLFSRCSPALLIMRSGVTCLAFAFGAGWVLDVSLPFQDGQVEVDLNSAGGTPVGLPPFYVPVPMLVLARFLGRADPAVAHQ